jgi:hypothetical protein
MKTCIKCHANCSQQESTSQKNFGRTYWACPNKCKKAFNGFVTADDNAQQPNKHPCKACNAECNILQSKSSANKGRLYFACPNQCSSTWNGWYGSQPTVKREEKMQAACPVPAIVEQRHQQQQQEQQQQPSRAKLCPLCKAVCVVQVMRFFDRQTEVYYRCKACQLFCGFVSDLPVHIVSENVQVFENTAMGGRRNQKPSSSLKRMAQNLPTYQQQEGQNATDGEDQTDESCVDDANEE